MRRSNFVPADMPFTLHPSDRTRAIGFVLSKSWMLAFRCENGHPGELTCEQMAERFAPEVTLQQIADRLVCRTCGSRDGDLSLRQDHGATAVRDAVRLDEEERTGKRRR